MYNFAHEQTLLHLAMGRTRSFRYEPTTCTSSGPFVFGFYSSGSLCSRGSKCDLIIKSKKMSSTFSEISNWNYWPQVLGYLLGALGASFAQLQSGLTLINITSRRSPITRLTKSRKTKSYALCLAGVLGALPTFMFVEPTSFKTAIAASFFVIPYIHSGNWVGLVQDRSNGV